MYALAAFCSFVALAAWLVRRRSAQRLINCIPGPKSFSWTYGNLVELFLTKEYGEHEFEWQETFGPVYAIKACFGETRLMISDPLTTKFILNSPVFVSGAGQQKAANALFGYGSVFMAKGNAHRHLRGIMNPWFSAKNVRSTIPVIKDTAMKLVDRWESLGYPGTTADVTLTLHDAAVDLVGAAILEHPFNGLSGQSEMARIQRGLVNSLSSASKASQIVDACLQYIPDFVFSAALHLPIPATRMLREYRNATNQLSRQLIQQKRDTMGSKKDDAFISGLMRPADGDTTVGVPDDEIAVHLRTILFAGEDTTGCTLGWLLYELARMPDFQNALREEIYVASTKTGDRLDYDNMPLLNALINECLRMYPALPMAERVATEDCVLPLSRPITTTRGAQISDIPIKKGQYVYIAIGSYHRLASVWGPDARVFRPSRWLGDQPGPSNGSALGPHASLLSFLAGPNVCLGWRFAILELQVIVAEVVRKFALRLPAANSVRPQCFGLTLVPKSADGKPGIPLHIEGVE
ncbi:cytochrome P450 [Mycena pura]|uniref:Cytochrome P450 n=1 Tax=Mycena pura TaxID=153505 RepID=A0AAD6VUV6_9AGAR|nr:cytochrome P450 [Mycena pura]